MSMSSYPVEWMGGRGETLHDEDREVAGPWECSRLAVHGRQLASTSPA